MENYTYLFKSYPSGTKEEYWYRKVRREFQKGQYSPKSCLEIEKRTQGEVMARTLRPDLFVQLDHEQQLKVAILTWCQATPEPRTEDKQMMEAFLKRYEGRDNDFFNSLKAVVHV